MRVPDFELRLEFVHLRCKNLAGSAFILEEAVYANYLKILFGTVSDLLITLLNILRRRIDEAGAFLLAYHVGFSSMFIRNAQ